MQEFPHHYKAHASSQPEGDVNLDSPNLPTLQTAPPEEFGGPGDRWSPESLMVGAIANCFVMSFRAIARASHLPWESLACEAEGTLERVERVTQFTEFQIHATLITPETNESKVERILHKAEQTCLITNSLKGATHLKTKIILSEGNLN